MASSIEMRQYLRKYTLEDLKNGLQSVRVPVGPMVNGQQPVEVFCPPATLQFRVKEKVHVDGKPTVEWGPWEDVPMIREGDDAPGV